MNDRKNIYVVYSSRDEAIVCVIEDEHKVLREFFEEGGRVLEEYDRRQTIDMPCISSIVHLHA